MRVFERTRSNMPHSIDPRSYESPEGQRPAVTQPIELERRPHDPYAAFRFGGFSLFTAGNLLSITGRQMLAIAVEWELYARTHSATAWPERPQSPAQFGEPPQPILIREQQAAARRSVTADCEILLCAGSYN